MASNCRNCGAPHNGIKCNYCGTYYGKSYAIINNTKVNYSDLKTEVLPKWKKWLFIVVGVIVAVFVLHLAFKGKTIRTKIN